MHKTNRLFHGRKWIALCAAMILMLTAFALPLQAASPYRRDDRGIVGDIRDGVRRFGRDVSDALDPDNGVTNDGLLPDGSIDDGMANDGSQNTPDNGGILPGTTTDHGNGAVTTPHTPTVTDDGLTPGTDGVAPGTTAPTTSAPTTTAPVTDNGVNDTVEEQNGGFRWMGLIIGLVIAAAVDLIIILLVPKKKH